MNQQYSRVASRSSERYSKSRADASTIHNKFLVGYRGWFTCPGDGIPLTENGWSGWFTDTGRLATDLWPDVSEYPPSELFLARPLDMEPEDRPLLFSSRSPGTVRRHFEWMAKYGVDGAFLYRKLSQCDSTLLDGAVLRWRDNIGRLVQEASELEGRVFASCVYDIGGLPADLLQKAANDDWAHLIRDERVLDSPGYLRERGKPVIGLSGFGFSNSSTKYDPDMIRAIVRGIRNTTPGGAYIIASAPSHWRTGDGDADPDPEYLDVWLNEFDAISPWTVGVYETREQADHYAQTCMKEDLALLNQRNDVGKWRRVDLISVVLPGRSAHNASNGREGFNGIKRNGGHFLWKQIHNTCDMGARIIYGATWDEYDEGTAFMPSVANESSIPVSRPFPIMSLDVDGYEVPPDWYMRICGVGAEVLRGEFLNSPDLPLEDLIHYWDIRARRAPEPVSQPFMRADTEEQAPPPYSESSPSSSVANYTAYPPPTSCFRISSSRPLPPLPNLVRSISWPDALPTQSMVPHSLHDSPVFTRESVPCKSRCPSQAPAPSPARSTYGTRTRDSGRVPLRNNKVSAISTSDGSFDHDSQSQEEVQNSPTAPVRDRKPRSDRMQESIPWQSASVPSLTASLSNLVMSEERHGFPEPQTRFNVCSPIATPDAAIPAYSGSHHYPNRSRSSSNSALARPPIRRTLCSKSAADSGLVTLRWIPDEPPATHSECQTFSRPLLLTERGRSSDTTFNSRLTITVPDTSPTRFTTTQLDSSPTSADSGMPSCSNLPGTAPISPDTSATTGSSDDVSTVPSPTRMRRSDSIRSFVRRLKRKESSVDLPPVPSIPPNLGSSIAANASSSVVSLSTTKEARRKKEEMKERREELAQSLKARAVAQDSLKSTSKRPQQREDLSLFGIPDGGFGFSM